MKEVVFVDDEADIVELFEELLDDAPVKVTTFTDPLEAVAYINGHTVDMCFLDYRMPGIDGIALRAQLPEALQCFLMTGELDMECPEGFVRCFSKPLRFDEIEAIVEQI